MTDLEPLRALADARRKKRIVWVTAYVVVLILVILLVSPGGAEVKVFVGVVLALTCGLGLYLGIRLTGRDTLPATAGLPKQHRKTLYKQLRTGAPLDPDDLPLARDLQEKLRKQWWVYPLVMANTVLQIVLGFVDGQTWRLALIVLLPLLGYSMVVRRRILAYPTGS